ncbi:Aste57867_14365 [Aphanomyces stellatus]|uniref:Aste57867_14365 protein n=1 Tax=Aphanomyces stellatus TaxID=120398 RepID=A0A485L1B1_9STRA|nr:hypothetical protein As57867_014311 [Aphanomyces stellatus]VFT91188.1 Aste57867_14365 [Aphanomyces stellatus]
MRGINRFSVAHISPPPSCNAGAMDLTEFMDLVKQGLACLAAIFIIFSEITGSIATKRMLLGATSDPASANVYRSPLFVPFLAALLTNLTAVRATIDALAPGNNQSTVVYLDGDSTNVSLNAMCSQPSAADFLYDPTVLLPLLGHILAPSRFLLEVEPLVLVDCFYDGRILPDTTTLKVIVVDPAFTTLTTVFVQSLTISRPRIRRESAGGLATFTSTPLASCYKNRFAFKAGKNIKCATTATYNMTVGFEFPYEAKDFVLVNMSLTPTSSGAWPAQVVLTGEDIVLMGTEGIYRSAPDIQGSYDWYWWQLPPDPLQFMANIVYVNVYHIKDTRGYFRCFLGLGIAFNLLVIGLVSLVVMVNLYRHDRIFWLPDLYPTIQRRASLRAVLLAADCVVNRWWYPFQFAFNEAKLRAGYGGTSFLYEMVRADGLMVCLAITQATAVTLSVRVRLHVTILVFLLCFEYRTALVDQINLFSEATSSYVTTSYLNQVFADESVPNIMAMWAWVDTPDTSLTLLVHQYAWLFVAIGVNVGYVVLEKLVKEIMARRRQQRVGPSPVSNQSFSVVFGHLKSRRHWSVRSTLDHPLSAFDVDGTCFERSVGTIVSHIVGFVAPSVNYVEPPSVVVVVGGSGTRRQTKALVSRSGVWLLGYVVLADRFVVEIHDVPLAAINAFLLLLNPTTRFQRPLFRVYGFHLDSARGPAGLPKTILTHVDITTPSNLLQLTLKELP